MDLNTATVKISLQEGSFEISGSEKFVTETIEKIEKILASNSRGDFKKNNTNAQKIEDTSKTNLNSGKKNNDDLALNNVFDFNGDKIGIILKTIPGGTKPKQTANVAILYLFGLNEKKGEQEVDKKIITALCKRYNCLDASNFASHIKKEKQYLIYEGNKIRITQPGLNEAENLIKKINEATSK